MGWESAGGAGCGTFFTGAGLKSLKGKEQADHGSESAEIKGLQAQFRHQEDKGPRSSESTHLKVDRMAMGNSRQKYSFSKKSVPYTGFFPNAHN